MLRSALIPMVLPCVGLTFAAVAQTQQADVGPDPSHQSSADTDLVKSVTSLEKRIVAIERLLEARKDQAELGRGLIPFDNVVTNLRSERLTRYVGLSIVLAVDNDTEQSAVQAITPLKPPLKDWLLLHLSDKTLEDVNGRQKRISLRDEIQRGFNSQLTEAGYSGFVKSVLFIEFSIQ